MLPPETSARHPDRERDHFEPSSKTTHLYAALHRKLSYKAIDQTLAHIDARIRRPYEYTRLDRRIGLYHKFQVGNDDDIEVQALETFLLEHCSQVVVRLKVPANDIGLRRDLDAIPAVLVVDEDFEEIFEYCLADMGWWG